MTFEGELTEEEKIALFNYRSSELFRIVQKAIASEYQKVGARMDRADAHTLVILQGQRQGLVAASNIMLALGMDPTQSEDAQKL